MVLASPTIALKGTVTSMNVTSWGSIGPCIEALDSGATVLLLQEHHVLDPTKLAAVQHEMLDHGFSRV